MLCEALDADPRTHVFGEFSRLSADDKQHGIRLNPLVKVNSVISRVHGQLVVLKPIVESQRTVELLQGISHSRALWLFRHYEDVASSDLRRFGPGNGTRNLRPIVHQAPDNWRSQNISGETREMVLRYYSEDMNPFDAAALFWFIRNRFFFQQGLGDDPRVILAQYEDLVLAPGPQMRRIYRFLGQDYPGDHIVRRMHPISVGRGKDIDLSGEIRDLCEGMLARLLDVYQRQAQKTHE